MTIKQQLVEEISKVVKDLGIVDVEPKVEYPADPKHGDYSTNVALVGSKKLGKNPMELAEEIVAQLKVQSENPKVIEKVEVVKPGFINFWIADEFFVQKLQKSEKSTSSTVEFKNGKIGIEHTQPNTNKPLHIGHVRNTVLGMSLVKLKQATGWEAESWNINNDRGIHIVKSMWGYKKYGDDTKPESITIETWKEIQKNAGYDGKFDYLFSTKPDHFIGMFYVIGTNKYEEDESAKKEMEEMLKAWEDGDEKVHELWKTMNTWFYGGMKQTLDLLGTKFDHEWYESEIYSKGKEIIEKGIEEGKLERSEDGHVEADLSKYKLPNVVLLRSNGTALYITQDIELARQRIRDEKFDYAMVITGNEQNLRFKQLYRVCEILGIAEYEKLLHLGYGMVRLKSGKMSSRKGTAISADDLVAEVINKVSVIMSAQNDDSDFSERVSQVAIGAIKYTMLKYGVLSDISFDIESSISTEGDSGPYIQYVYARTQSVLAKRATENLEQKTKNDWKFEVGSLKFEAEERELLRMLAKFDEVIEDAAERFAPNIVCTYLFELAQAFNLFYQKCPIIKSGEEVREFRLSLTSKTGEVIKKGLYLLGIDAPSKM